MSRNDRGPVSMLLVAGAAAIVITAMLAQYFGVPVLGSLCRTWLLLPLVLG